MIGKKILFDLINLETVWTAWSQAYWAFFGSKFWYFNFWIKDISLGAYTDQSLVHIPNISQAEGGKSWIIFHK